MFEALERLPEEIAELSSLKRLTLVNTQVSDLAPLRGLTGLKRLDLTDTAVGRDQLSVLAGKPRLVPPDSLNALAPWQGVRLEISKAA
ncbi:MAG: hypothetical protein C0524_03960 [Rhodobacter sp.]|nr:hypothetical protein [Rhodobacter sp.]